jgi:hypothetical protein
MYRFQVWKSFKSRQGFTEEMAKKKNILPGAFIAFIMIFSVFGVMFYGFSNPGTKLEYNGYKFKSEQGLWVTSVDGRAYRFTEFPGNLERINVSSGVIDRIRGTRMVYLTYDPNQTVVQEIAGAQFQLQQDLAQFNIHADTAMTVENEYGLPVVTCADATQFVPVLDFREDETSIELVGNCVVVSAYRDDFGDVRDRLVLGMLGIMQ